MIRAASLAMPGHPCAVGMAMSARDLVGDWEYKVIYSLVENAGARRPV